MLKVRAITSSTRYISLSTSEYHAACRIRLQNTPGKPIEDAANRRRFKETHGRTEDGMRHSIMEFSRSLDVCKYVVLSSRRLTNLNRTENPEKQRLW